MHSNRIIVTRIFFIFILCIASTTIHLTLLYVRLNWLCFIISSILSHDHIWFIFWMKSVPVIRNVLTFIFAPKMLKSWVLWLHPPKVSPRFSFPSVSSAEWVVWLTSPVRCPCCCVSRATHVFWITCFMFHLAEISSLCWWSTVSHRGRLTVLIPQFHNNRFNGDFQSHWLGIVHCACMLLHEPPSL